MSRAIELALRGWGQTSPNPIVGAVVVRKGKMVGEGYHKRAGLPHAEINALRKAGRKARGADLYVNMEPCCHFGRTPPCTEAIIKAGIKRVFFGMQDPNPRVAGKGLKSLRAAGVKVVGPILEDACKRLNRPFMKWVTTGRPYVTAKIAMTLDGKIADARGGSKWISNEVSRMYAHWLRAGSDVVMVGAGTARRDRPRLNVRLPGYKGRQPVPIVVKRGTDLKRLFKGLGAAGFQSVLVEGGSRLHTSLIKAGLVDYFVIFLAPKLLGSNALPWLGDIGRRAIRNPLRLAIEQAFILGNDLVLKASLAWGSGRTIYVFTTRGQAEVFTYFVDMRCLVIYTFLMARKPRIEYPGALYHVISRGNRKQDVCLDGSDYKDYLARLRRYHDKYKFIIYAYCLMPNHIHLLIEAGETPLSKIMHALQFSYTQSFNKRHKKVGHLFQGRYKAILCNKDAYLLELIRYIHLNSIRSGLVSDPKDYVWSSHREYIGLEGPKHVDIEPILGLFGRSKKTAVQSYNHFIKDGMGDGHKDEFYQLKDQRILGDDEFAEDIIKNSDGWQGEYWNISLSEIVEGVCREFDIKQASLLSVRRRHDLAIVNGVIAHLAKKLCGATLVQVGGELKRSERAMSHVLHRIEEKIEDDSSFAQRIKTLERHLTHDKRRLLVREKKIQYVKTSA